MDATLLTAVRTGAAAAVASRALARPAPRTIGFVGSGVQARTMLAAHVAVYGDALEIVASDSDPEAAARFAGEAGGRVASVEEAAGCDIVNTSTPGRVPVVARAWVQPGAHINAMGADAPGKQELTTELVLASKIVIDDHHQATHSGEINVPLHTGALSEASLHGTLGDVLTKRIAARTGDEITLFDSTGLAIQDVALAWVLYQAARQRGVGTLISLVE
jgi:ornithine cyclodeaminase/alanine dehydrogenase